MSTHYDTLGVSEKASQSEIKAAYRKLAREVHPDVSDFPDAAAKFQLVQQAYEVLSDPRRRDGYDLVLASQRRPRDQAEKERLEAEELKRRAEERMKDAPQMAKIDLEKTNRLTQLVSVGKIIEAEKLAKEMLAEDSRQPVPHAVLGDIARLRGDFQRALQDYGLAAQYEPRNPIYQRRYEQMMDSVSATKSVGGTYVPEIKIPPLGIAIFLVIIMAVYTVFAVERPLNLPFAPTWTLGTMGMLLISGVVVGTCLVLSGALTGFDVAAGSAVMRVSPATALGLIALASFWVACLLYFIVGQTQQAFNRSLSLVLGCVAGTVLVFTLAGLSKGPMPAMSNLIWGGNLVYLGALAGWFVTDSLGRSSSS